MKRIHSLGPSWALHLRPSRVGIFILCGLLSGCGHESSKEHMERVWDNTHPRQGVYEMGGFWVDDRSPPDRPVQLWEFYYKHCSLERRKPYPDAAEYLCTSPY